MKKVKGFRGPAVAVLESTELLYLAPVRGENTLVAAVLVYRRLSLSLPLSLSLALSHSLTLSLFVRVWS